MQRTNSQLYECSCLMSISSHNQKYKWSFHTRINRWTILYVEWILSNTQTTVKLSQCSRSTSNQSQNKQTQCSFPFVAWSNRPIQHVKVSKTCRENLENSGTYLWQEKMIKNSKKGNFLYQEKDNPATMCQATARALCG